MAHHSPTNVLHRLADLLLAHRSLLATHPNDCNLSVVPETWTASPEELTKYYATGLGGHPLPQDLKKLIDDIREMQIPRAPPVMLDGKLFLLPSNKGMSPKKFHEVQRMASYVKSLVDSVLENSQIPGNAQGRLHIVDIGAGQGYLTRALGALFPGARLLALDADHGQTTGAERRGKQQRRVDAFTAELNSRIDHRTVLITPESLLQVVDDWIDEEDNGDPPMPVLFVALHACGSLTPDTLRAFLSRVSRPTPKLKGWRPFSIVAVGCCYNLMYPEGNAGRLSSRAPALIQLFFKDYPLSQTLCSYKPAIENPLTASSSHLAAQIPMTWLRKDPSNKQWTLQQTVKMAIQKIVWRALLEFALAGPYCASPISITPRGARHYALRPKKWMKISTDVPVFDRLPKARPSDTPLEVQLQGVGQTEVAVCLGKLPDSAYNQGWEHFLKVAGEKLGVAWDFDNADSLRHPALERRIEVLHTIRCFLGSAVESVILLDRLKWIQEELDAAAFQWHSVKTEDCPRFVGNWDVGLINLFDQGVGSGRNIGLVIAPIIPSGYQGNLNTEKVMTTL